MIQQKTSFALRSASLVIAAVIMVACQKATHHETLTALPQCDVERVQHHLGQPFKEGMASTLQNEAKAEEVRVISPNTPETRDYRHERLTIRTDAQGLIVSLSCG